MHNHPVDADIAVFDDISEAAAFNPGWLSRRFGAVLPKAAIHQDERLTAFCEDVDYARDGFLDLFNRNAEGVSYSLGTVYSKGNLDFIYHTTLFHERIGDICPQRSEKAFLVPGMHRHYGRWSEIFKNYGDYIRPGFGSEFGMRIVSRSEPELRLHTDHKRYEKIACTPLGADKASTVIQAADGTLIEPPACATVFTRRGTIHSSPPSTDMRVIISAAPIERDSVTGLVMGFGS